MNDQRKGDRLEATTCELRTPLGRGGWHSRALRVREVHRSFLDDGAPLEYTRPGESAAGLFALFGEVRAAILCLERAADAVLEVEQKIADRGYGRELHAHSLAGC